MCVLGKLREGGAQDARDLHLRAADALADFGLGEILAEAKMDRQRVAFGQCGEQVIEHGGGFGGGEARVVGSSRSARV